MLSKESSSFGEMVVGVASTVTTTKRAVARDELRRADEAGDRFVVETRHLVHAQPSGAVQRAARRASGGSVGERAGDQPGLVGEQLGADAPTEARPGTTNVAGSTPVSATTPVTSRVVSVGFRTSER